MLAITVHLLHGTIRAGSPDDVVQAGGSPHGEWPPSPARLFSALVAADGTGARMAGTTGSELMWLETLAPPLIYASGTDMVEKSTLAHRYVVIDKRDTGNVHDYPARKASEVRPGVRFAPCDVSLTYLWSTEKATASAEDFTALRYRAARVGYFGCADSPVQVTVTDSSPEKIREPWCPGESGDVTLPIPYPGFLKELDFAYDEWSAKRPTRRSWIPTKRVYYQEPIDGSTSRSLTVPSTRRVIWLRFNHALSGRNLLQVTDALKAAVLDHLQRLAPEDEIPAWLHGHWPPGEHGQQADFIGLPDIGHEHATGRLLGAAISMPADADPVWLQRVRTAVFNLATGELFPRTSAGGNPTFNVRVSVYGGERRPLAVIPLRWTGPSTTWVSATPVVHERWTKGSPDIDEVASWCSHAGIAAHPIEVGFPRRPAIAGALDLPPDLVFRSKQERRPYSHIEVRFKESIQGPIVLGRNRQFGFGLLVPVRGTSGNCAPDV